MGLGLYSFNATPLTPLDINFYCCAPLKLHLQSFLQSLCDGRNFGADQLRRIWSAQGYFTILHDQKREVTARKNPAPDKT
jgi:hypothetical protein